jgi:drug/metabolite transporter (DMT)-like permease
MNKFLLAIPAICDFFTSTLHYIALNFISGSIYQMLRGGTIITTCIFSVLVLKIKIQKSQYLGSGLALIGVVIVGVSNYMFSGSSSS